MHPITMKPSASNNYENIMLGVEDDIDVESTHGVGDVEVVNH